MKFYSKSILINLYLNRIIIQNIYLMFFIYNEELRNLKNFSPFLFK